MAVLENVLEELGRLKKSTRNMPVVLELEIVPLEQRLKDGDMSAA